MHTFELIVALMASVVVLVWIAERVNIPYPMFLMAGGLALAIIPWTPTIELDPEIVLVIFLPPVLFDAAQKTSVRDFTANFGPISRLAVTLVLFTTASVAIVAHWLIPGIGWPAAFVLGAVVSPPDAVAAMAIFQRIGAPHRIVTILEGESLINDASAIVVYTFAVAAVVTGSFSLSNALLKFVIVVIVAVAVGGIAGRLLGSLIALLGDPSLASIVTLLAPAAIYVISEDLGGSGVLAVVVAGIIHGFRSPRTMSPSMRNQNVAIWDVALVVINGFIFILMGMELGILRDTLSTQDIWDVFGHSLAVVATMIAARFFYVLSANRVRTSRRRRRGPELRQRREGMGSEAPPPGPLDLRGSVLIAWSGLRGVVSMATALALPLVTDAGQPFDHRDEIILITSAVIIVTLFGFGLPLPWVLRKLQPADDGRYEQEMQLAKTAVRKAMHATMTRLMETDQSMKEAMAPMMREMEAQFARLSSLVSEGKTEEIDQLSRPRNEARLQAVNAARIAVIDLRDRGLIGDEVRREIERSLDLQELQMATF